MPIRLNNLHAHQSLAAELYQGKKKYKTKITQKLEAWIHTKRCRSFRSQWKYACVHNGRNKDWIWTILMSIILQTVARALLKIALELEIVRICWLRQSYQRVSYHSVIKSGGRDGWWKDCLSFPSYESVNLKVDNVKIVLMTWILGFKKCVQCYTYIPLWLIIYFSNGKFVVITLFLLDLP